MNQEPENLEVKSSAPSNIALIKYMGKTDSRSNVPTNSSFSLTLENLRTFVEIEAVEGPDDQWDLLQGEHFQPFEMSEKGRARFLAHFQFLKTTLGIQGSYLVKSANNFPSDCGLASSASSFAALTRATGQLAKATGGKSVDDFALAELSRKGSGSSCRSFFGPWVMWSAAGVKPLEFPMAPLRHSVIIVESKKKAVSSSEAHKRVATSLLFHGRPERAESRLASLLLALREGDWKEIFELSWAEFWDMHALFETSKPSFGYFENGTMDVLASLRYLWQSQGDGPIVTMDAGANIHLMFRHDQADMQKAFLQQWQDRFTCFSSENSGHA